MIELIAKAVHSIIISQVAIARSIRNMTTGHKFAAFDVVIIKTMM